MKNTIKYITLALVGAFAAISCTKPEAMDLQPAYKYTDAYYKALRSWKESDHAICYVWFANYEAACPGSRFMGLPDSVDVVSLWGGIPKDEAMKAEMYKMRELKGTRLVGVKIIRLAPSNRNYYNYLSWAKASGIKSFDEGYPVNEQGESVNKGYKATYEEKYKQYCEETTEAGTRKYTDEQAASLAESDALAAGCSCLRADMAANPSRTGEEGSYEYPDWCVKSAGYILDEINEYKLDGYDLDFEPEGDALNGACMTTFVQYLGQFIGPKSNNPRTVLNVDGGFPDASVAEYISYHVAQSYGQSPNEGMFNRAGWKNSQLIITENIGDNWKNGGVMEAQAAFQPKTGGRKGGFGAFHNQRDYAITAVGGDKDLPYGHLRRAIQLQNPAVNK